MADLDGVFRREWGPAMATEIAPQNTEAIAAAPLHQFIVPFEIASLLLLVSMIGAVVLARRRV
jgi:NADH:ubiquinone oxidoreductase subunit 6 (subunit J)